MSNVDMNQALIYSSSDGIAWAPHETVINPQTQEATATTTHFSFFALTAPRIDVLPPETSISFDQAKLSGGAYPLPLKISLSVNDASPSAGPGHTFYRLNNEEWQLFSEPIEATQAGDHTIHYYSTDAVDNIEVFKSASFSALLAPTVLPELFIRLSDDFKTIEIDSNEAEAQIIREQLSSNHEKITADVGSGAKTSLTVKQNKILLTETWELTTLQYGDDPELALPPNLYTITRVKSYKKPYPYTAIIQSCYMNRRGVLLTYYPRKNITTVVELLNNRKLSTKTYAGFKQLELATLDGQIVYNY
jgi:hypothetical protein